MDVPEYILSRIEEGEPGFDLDWENMREIPHDVAEGRFAVGGRQGAENMGLKGASDAEAMEKAVAMLERQYNTAIIPELRDSLKSAISVLERFRRCQWGRGEIRSGGGGVDRREEKCYTTRCGSETADGGDARAGDWRAETSAFHQRRSRRLARSRT